MNRVRTALSTVLFVTSFVLSAKPAFALVPIIKEISKVDIKTVSCVILANNIDDRVNNFSARYENHLEVYARLVDRLEQMIEKWQGWGYETNDIEGDLDNLKEMIDEYKEDHTNFLTKLTETKNACGTSSYATKISDAKAALKELRGDVVSIRNLYQSVMRQHILELKEQEI